MAMNCAPFEFSCAVDGPQVKIEAVLDHLKQTGVSEEGCNNYYADEKRECSNLNKCKDCANGEDIHREAVCTPKHFAKYRIKNYGKITTDESKPDIDQ